MFKITIKEEIYMNLVYLDGKKELYTTNEIIAEYAEIDRISVRKLIESHKEDLEVFGVLSFEMTKPSKQNNSTNDPSRTQNMGRRNLRAIRAIADQRL